MAQRRYPFSPGVDSRRPQRTGREDILETVAIALDRLLFFIRNGPFDFSRTNQRRSRNQYLDYVVVINTFSSADGICNLFNLLVIT